MTTTLRNFECPVSEEPCTRDTCTKDSCADAVEASAKAKREKAPQALKKHQGDKLLEELIGLDYSLSNKPKLP